VSNPSGRKGSEWERACEELLRARFPYVYRMGKQGRIDKGDFGHTEAFCFEAKNQKAIDLAGFIDEANTEAGHAGADWPVVLIKRRRKPADRGYAVMEIGTFLALIGATDD